MPDTDKIVMTAVFNQDDTITYSNPSGYSMTREYGKTPNGNDLEGEWVLRKNGEFVDFDQYRIDLAERNHLDLIDYLT